MCERASECVSHIPVFGDSSKNKTMQLLGICVLLIVIPSPLTSANTLPKLIIALTTRTLFHRKLSSLQRNSFHECGDVKSKSVLLKLPLGTFLLKSL